MNPSQRVNPRTPLIPQNPNPAPAFTFKTGGSPGRAAQPPRAHGRPLLPTRPYCGENGRRPPRLVSGFLFLVLGRLYGEVGGRPRGSERRQ